MNSSGVEQNPREPGETRRPGRAFRSEGAESRWLLVVPLLLLLVDLGVFLAWDRLERLVGSWLGIEMGLLFFLNVLGAFLVLEYLESRQLSPRLFSWYYRLPLGIRTERLERLDSGWTGLRGQWKFLVGLTVAFYLAENFLFSLVVPPRVGLLVDGLLVALIVFARVFLPLPVPGSSRSRVRVRDRS